MNVAPASSTWVAVARSSRTSRQIPLCIRGAGCIARRLSVVKLLLSGLELHLRAAPGLAEQLQGTTRIEAVVSPRVAP